MRCPRCTAENPDDASLCVACGAGLPSVACARCGAQNPPRNRFCGECACQVGTAHHVPAPVVPPAEAERRQITVLFCDLVGSTSLSQELDPEDFREVVRAYQSTCAEIVVCFDGHVALFLGDGVLVYFGYPSAHEDDAARAVRAGLQLVESVGALKAKGRSLRVRVGIHTGLVVVGEVGFEGHWAQLAIGETPNFAFRVQNLADPDTVLITDATHRLVSGFFTCADRGQHALGGGSNAIKIHRVLGESGARSRMDAAATTGFTPYVGRKAETKRLLDTWEAVRAGDGRAIAIRGEAGIGKSRLLEMLKSQVDRERNPVAECRCSPNFTNTALFPIVDFLERLLGLRTVATSEVKLTRLTDALSESGPHSPQAIPLLAALLSIPLCGRYPDLQLTPERQRQRTLGTLVEWLAAMATRKPVLLILEDLPSERNDQGRACSGHFRPFRWYDAAKCP